MPRPLEVETRSIQYLIVTHFSMWGQKNSVHRGVFFVRDIRASLIRHL